MMKNTTSVAVQQLLGAQDAILHGIDGIGIERIWQSHNISRTKKILLEGDCAEITDLIREVLGETASLVVHAAPMGEQANTAMCNSYVNVFISIRENMRHQLSEHKQIGFNHVYDALEQTQHIILGWVEHGEIRTGIRRSEDYDLGRIANDFLITPELRLASIASIFAACALVNIMVKRWDEHQSSRYTL